MPASRNPDQVYTRSLELFAEWHVFSVAPIADICVSESDSDQTIPSAYSWHSLASLWPPGEQRERERLAPREPVMIFSMACEICNYCTAEFNAVIVYSIEEDSKIDLISYVSMSKLIG